MGWSEHTAIFGGRFDPPHAGHLIALEGLLKDPGVKSLWVLPVGRPGHKPVIASITHRQAMLELALAPLQARGVDVELCDAELRRAKQNPDAETRSYETLVELRAQAQKEGRGPLAFVLGTDQFRELPRWHRFPDVLSLVDWIVLERKTVDKSATGSSDAFEPLRSLGLLRQTSDRSGSLPGGRKVIQVPTPAPAISSSALRAHFALSGGIDNTVNDTLKDALPPEILGYLMEHRLYGIAGDNDTHR